MTELLNRQFTLSCSRAHAFKVFTQMIDLWWPRGHRRTEGSTLILQPTQGGRLFERAPDGSEWTLGEIITFDPPSKLAFQWFPGAPNAPTHVEVDFTEQGEGASISVTHSAITPEAINIWPDKVALFERGWDTILPALQSYINTKDNSDD